MIKYWTKLMLILAVAILLNGCNSEGNTEEKEAEKSENATEETNIDLDDQMEPQATAELKDVDDNTVGMVNFYEYDDYLLIDANADGLEPGHHGFHIHEKGVCEPDAEDGPFTTAGGHYNPEEKKHPDHAGDMPTLYVNEDGKANYSVTFDRLSIEQLKEEELAIIVHAKPDNFSNIPDRYQAEGEPGPDEETVKAGDAGDRQACGVINTVEEETKK